MGGKTWSPMEEHVFWQHIVPKSPKAVDAADRVKSWEECAQEMQEVMAEDARRKYTKLMLFEHYFQNVSTGHKSPNARKHVADHKQQLEEVKEKNKAAKAALFAEDFRRVSSASSVDGSTQSSVLTTQEMTNDPPHLQGLPTTGPQMPQRPQAAQVTQMAQMAQTAQTPQTPQTPQMAHMAHMAQMAQMAHLSQRPQVSEASQLSQMQHMQQMQQQMQQMQHIQHMQQMQQMQQNHHAASYPQNYNHQVSSSHTMAHQAYHGHRAYGETRSGFIGAAPPAASSVEFEHAMASMGQSARMPFQQPREDQA